MEGGRRGCCAVSSMAPTQVGVIQQVSNSKNDTRCLAYTLFECQVLQEIVMSTGKPIYRRFGEWYRLHFQDHVVQEELCLKTENPGVKREGETFSSYCGGPDFVSTYLHRPSTHL